MTYLINRKKLFLPGIILLVIFSTAIFISCRKNNETMQEISFNAPAAKEWFYGTFKKTNEYATAATAGKQLPDWKSGRYKKTGNMEMVEYDLVQQKKTALVAPTGNRFEDKRIAEATVNRALFVKNGNETKLFIVQFIPGADYAKANGYDISKNTFARPDKNFTGKLLIKNWNNELVKGYNIANGKKENVIKQIVKENSANRTDINPDCYYSYTAWFEQDCSIIPIGDNVALENCSEWQMMWESITETYCPVGPSECELLGLDQEACMCQMLGVCNGGGGEENQDEAIIAEHNSAKDADWEYTTEFDYTCPNSPNPVTYHYNGWKIARHAFGLWDVTADSRWRTSVNTGTINVSEFLPVSTALNQHTLMIFNSIEWKQGVMTNNTVNYNNTANPKGRQDVTGTIRIKSKLPTELFGLLDIERSAHGKLYVNFHL